MKLPRGLSRRFTVLAIVWQVATLSLASWWWWHSVHEAGNDEHVRRMFLWEGSFFLFVLLVGGIGLVYLTHHHQERHDRLKMFFSIFAHDLKTSMARLRLQGELLEESPAGRDPKVRSMLKDIQRLDLQLENSLWMAQLESHSLLVQKVTIREVMDHLRNEFTEVRMEMNRNAELFVDRRAFTVVLRNLFHNSILHGKASCIDLQVAPAGAGRVRIEIGDNGSGPKGVEAKKLGSEILSSTHDHSNGLGLYLSRRLVERMQGDLEFTLAPRFLNVVIVRGGLA